jgi:hypothetical protein
LLTLLVFFALLSGLAYAAWVRRHDLVRSVRWAMARALSTLLGPQPRRLHCQVIEEVKQQALPSATCVYLPTSVRVGISESEWERYEAIVPELMGDLSDALRRLDGTPSPTGEPYKLLGRPMVEVFIDKHADLGVPTVVCQLERGTVRVGGDAPVGGGTVAMSANHLVLTLDGGGAPISRFLRDGDRLGRAGGIARRVP